MNSDSLSTAIVAIVAVAVVVEKAGLPNYNDHVVRALLFSSTRDESTVFAYAIAGAVAGAFVGAIASRGAGAVAGVVVGAVTSSVLAHGYGYLYSFYGFALCLDEIVHIERILDVIFAGAFTAFDVRYAIAVVAAAAMGGTVAGVAVAIVKWAKDIAIRNQWYGTFLLFFAVSLTAGCLTASQFISLRNGWEQAGPLLLFLGLLPLLNAPFDWASIGLTRALLRRGIERGGWWPYLLALADALAAAAIIRLLAVTTVIGLQTFDQWAEHASGPRASVLDLHKLFDDIAAHPDAPEFWWVYALLLSTMIPSMINLVIGGTALMRTVPGVSSLLLRFLPAAGGVPAYDCAWIAAVLTLQAAFGAILGLGIQALVAWGLIFHLMPAVGLELLDLIRRLADPNLPMRLIRLSVGAAG